MLTAPYTVTDMVILFGIFVVEKVLLNLNFVLLFAKKHIHDCKMTNQNIAFFSPFWSSDVKNFIMKNKFVLKTSVSKNL